MLKNFFFVDKQVQLYFFFFFSKTHTQALANLSMLPCHQKQVSEQINSLGEHDKQRRGENCKVMVITCASACIHIMCVCMCEGATLQYRRKGRDSGGAYGYTAKTVIPHHQPLWQWEDVTWQCSIKSWCRFFFFFLRKKMRKCNVLFLPRGTTASFSTREKRKQTSQHVNTLGTLVKQMTICESKP